MNKNKLGEPMTKEDKFRRNIERDVKSALMMISEIDGDEYAKEQIANTISELGDIIKALTNANGVPRRLKRPWDIAKMS